MKRLLLVPLFFVGIVITNAQPGSWQQMKAVGWNAPNAPSARFAAVAFSIENKGYCGTGLDGGRYRNDFWQYDPVANTWTQMADVGGSPRGFAVGFSIGDKGYIGLGADTVFGTVRDFWEYDPVNNKWTKKNDFGGGKRSGSTAFTIGDRGYVATGQYYSDLWEYNPIADSWTRKAAFPGGARRGAIGFSIAGKGYIGTGNDDVGRTGNYKRDFWEYDPIADTWTRKADVGGQERTQATAFSIGNKGYVGLGFQFPGFVLHNDLWEYDPASDSWMNKTNFAGSPRNGAAGFTIDSNAYIISGWSGFKGGAPPIEGGGIYMLDCWKYNTLADSWTQIADFGVPVRAVGIGFGIGGKGYLGMGTSQNYSEDLDDIWEFDTLTRGWSQKASFPAGGRSEAIAFSIGNKGYVGFGFVAGNYVNDFWEFDPVLNTWLQKSSFGGEFRKSPVGISIGTKGYVGLGYSNETKLNDFWAFDPVANSWTQVASFPGVPRYNAVGFTIGTKGYVGLGNSGIPGPSDSTFWEYDPAADRWTQKSKYPGNRSTSVTFSIGKYGYLGLATLANNDFWQYDPTTDQWKRQTGFAGGGRNSAVGFSIGNKGYVGTGVIAYEVGIGTSLTADFWQYSPEGSVRTAIGDYSVSSACPVLSGTDYAWAADTVNSLVFGINPNNNNLNATCWAFRKVAAGAYRNKFGWFGESHELFGAFLERNYFITASLPDSSVTIRLYCTATDLTDFINYFNSTYGTVYSQSDIKVLRYHGINQDLDPDNNSNMAEDYTAISPTSISIYGPSGEYRFFEFRTPDLSEFYLTLTSPTGPLPVRLVNFLASYNNGATRLRWQTAQEVNLSRFDIQRSMDAKQFTNLGSVPAFGHSTSIRNYRFDDTGALACGAKTLYYRLAEIDLDGRQEYSNIATVNISDEINNISIRPNPGTDNITIYLNSITVNGHALFVITDITGRIIQTSPIMLAKGDNIVRLNIHNLSAGMYTISVMTNEKKRLAKFIKR